MLKTRLTLAPGANGTKKLVERYGGRLVCVRYRYDRERRLRIKTVELIEEEMPWTASDAIYLVKIGYEETSPAGKDQGGGRPLERGEGRLDVEGNRSGPAGTGGPSDRLAGAGVDIYR